MFFLQMYMESIGKDLTLMYDDYLLSFLSENHSHIINIYHNYKTTIIMDSTFEIRAIVER